MKWYAIDCHNIIFIIFNIMIHLKIVIKLKLHSGFS